MAVTKGFKLTEVGEIPEDWEVKEIGEITVKVGSGITPTGGEKIYTSKGHPFIRSQNIGWGELLLDSLAHIDKQTHSAFNGTEIKKDDILLNITGASIGRAAIADERIEKGNVNQHVCIIRLQNNLANSNFICEYLLSPDGQTQINNFQAGGNRQGLNFSQVKAIKITYPSLSEQATIASALSDADSLIASLEQLIAKKRLVKQGAMQELLTGKKRLPGFEEEWKEISISDALKVHHGKDQKEISSETGKYSILGTGGELGRTNYYLSEGPSVLIGRKGTIDKPQYVDFPFWTIDTLFYTDFFICHYPKFFYYLFCMMDWKRLNEASGVPSLNANNIENIHIIIPKETEQTAIASVLSDMDEEIAALEAKLEKTRKIKEGMMAELLSGRTRLV